MCNCVVEVTAKVASHLESQGVEIVGTPHWRWWIQNRKAKLKQERKQPPAEVDKFLENRND